MKKIILCAALVLSLLAGGSAWAQSVNSKVDYLGTSRFLKVTGIKAREVNRMLNLAIEITNSDNEDSTGYYRLTWMDADGFPVWDTEAWKPLVVHGGQIERVMVVAPTPKAVDFKIEFSADSNWGGTQGPADK